jgi:hypothetical protein
LWHVARDDRAWLRLPPGSPPHQNVWSRLMGWRQRAVLFRPSWPEALVTPLSISENERDIARQPVEFGNNQRGPVQPAGGERRRKLRAVVALVTLDLDEFGERQPTLASEELADRLALCVQP